MIRFCNKCGSENIVLENIVVLYNSFVLGTIEIPNINAYKCQKCNDCIYSIQEAEKIIGEILYKEIQKYKCQTNILKTL